MLFSVAERGQLPKGARDQFVLLRDQWNDWFEWVTQFRLVYLSPEGEQIPIGELKIGQIGLTPAQQTPAIPESFDALDSSFFSVGQDESYYENIKALGPTLREQVLRSLNDLAADEQLFEQVIDEPVVRSSLLRSVTRSAVRGQFRRMAKGDARLTRYRFAFNRESPPASSSPHVQLNFVVTPESLPPTNVHVIIGRNGVGKTSMLGAMTRALIGGAAARSASGYFSNLDEDDTAEMFAGLVTVSFSAFDSLPPLSSQQREGVEVAYNYVGLNKWDKKGSLQSQKAPAELEQEFVESLEQCRRGPRRTRWSRAVQTLGSDPLFEAAGVAELLVSEEDSRLTERARSLFAGLSSGHKIVLLTITRLVELVEERTLVLLDEPESHLHPPLLSAFTRALSDLLVQRNGVAIVATHSPVVVQEVPSSCVWKLRRSGTELRANRPENQTFGENVGVLTHEVFGLEVTNAGFHRMLVAAVDQGQSYEQVLESFDDQVGTEARAVLRALVSQRDREQGT